LIHREERSVFGIDSLLPSRYLAPGGIKLSHDDDDDDDDDGGGSHSGYARRPYEPSLIAGLPEPLAHRPTNDDGD
jgi:hypothetical protein